MILGDASITNGVCKKGNIDTPNTKLNKLIKENFKTYYIDEFRTSKLHYKTKRKERKIYSVLTFKMEKKQSGCINRDENAVNNMIKIVNHQIKYKERTLKYRRYNYIYDKKNWEFSIRYIKLDIS